MTLSHRSSEMNRLITNHGELHPRYTSNIINTINRAIEDHPRTMAIRIDLRIPADQYYSEHGHSSDSPSYFADTDRKVISRFICSLKAQVNADLLRKKKLGIRTSKNNLRYTWAKEYGSDNKPHYHVLLLLNKDNYAYLGSYQNLSGNLASKIQKAWTSALRLDFEYYKKSVHFPKNPVYLLNASSFDYPHVYEELLYRASYLAKLETKLYGTGTRSFGCSQR